VLSRRSKRRGRSSSAINDGSEFMLQLHSCTFDDTHLLVARFLMDFAKSTDFLYRETETFWAFGGSVYQFVATLYMTSADQRQSRYVPASYQNAEIAEGAWKRT